MRLEGKFFINFFNVNAVCYIYPFEHWTMETTKKNQKELLET